MFFGILIGVYLIFLFSLVYVVRSHEKHRLARSKYAYYAIGLHDEMCESIGLSTYSYDDKKKTFRIFMRSLVEEGIEWDGTLFERVPIDPPYNSKHYRQKLAKKMECDCEKNSKLYYFMILALVEYCYAGVELSDKDRVYYYHLINKIYNAVEINANYNYYKNNLPWIIREVELLKSFDFRDDNKRKEIAETILKRIC